jgi:DNA polymerase III sliding clamp (beta) subunit (PCNA family)
MKGEVKRIIDEIVAQRAHGDEVLMTTTKTRIALKGINLDDYTATTNDSDQDIATIKKIAVDMGITIS